MSKKLLLALVALMLLGGVVAVRSNVGSDGKGALIDIAHLPDTGQIVLGIGETGAFKGLLMRPVKVAEDSRCPSEVYCIQAGTVSVKLSTHAGLSIKEYTLKLGESVVSGTEKITFEAVTPTKRATEEISAREYRFTFNVAPIGE